VWLSRATPAHGLASAADFTPREKFRKFKDSEKMDSRPRSAMTRAGFSAAFARKMRAATCLARWNTNCGIETPL
jgi:hypothetical protein